MCMQSSITCIDKKPAPEEPKDVVDAIQPTPEPAVAEPAKPVEEKPEEPKPIEKIEPEPEVKKEAPVEVKPVASKHSSLK